MRGVLAVLVALCCAAAVSAIYEDQVGEFDWHRAGLGEVHRVAFPSKNSKNFLVTKAMYVATEANVLAKVDLKTSDVAWRHVLPEATAVEDLVFCDTHESVVSVSSSPASAASTRDATLVRQWDAVHGHLLWQAYVPVAAPVETPFAAAYEVRGATDADETILALVRNADVTILGLRAGDVLRTAAFPHAFSEVLSTKLSVDATKLYILGVDSVSKTKVVVQVVLKSASASVLALAQSSDVVGLYRDDDQDRVVAVAVIEDGSALHLQALYDLAVVNTIAIASLELSNPTPATPLTFTGIDKSVAHAFVVTLSNGKRLFARVSSSLALTVLASLPSSGFLIASAQAPGILFHAALHAAQNRVALVSYHADASPSMHLEASIDVALYGRAITRGFAGVTFKKAGKAISIVRVGLVMADASLILLSNEKPSDAINPGLVWIRDEALAYVTKAYWVTPAGIEEQALSVIPSFTEELGLEAKKLLHFFTTLGASPAKTASETSQFFGFSKLLILSTSTGKLYALASETGTIVWSRYVGRDHRLVVTRDHPAFGAGAELLLIGADTRLTWIDAEDGRVLASEAPSTQNDAYVMLLPKQKHHEMTEAVARRVVGVVDASLEVALYPPSSAVPDAFYFYRYDKAAHAFEGFRLDESKRATLVWSVVLPTDESIVAQSVQADATAIESSVTITGDDSLLVKYLNPHLFGVATLDAHNVLQVSLIDAVSGRIVHRAKHAQVAPSVQMVQSENWLVYTFWSLKTKRTELVSVALFERAIGARDLNPWVRPLWAESKSSFDAKAPYVLQKSFIFPSPVSSLGATLTARGITPQFVLVGMANGQIFKLARNIIDPRVPEGPPTPEQQEEGLVQYSPYIQVLAQPFSMVSHNQTLHKLQAIVSAPANLESTSLTFAFGLDLYYVRLAPANAFDVLPSDFNYELLLLLIAGFVGGAYGTKLLAERKLLHEQWK